MFDARWETGAPYKYYTGGVLVCEVRRTIIVCQAAVAVWCKEVHQEAGTSQQNQGGSRGFGVKSRAVADEVRSVHDRGSGDVVGGELGFGLDIK